jgi:hypothetical protein
MSSTAGPAPSASRSKSSRRRDTAATRTASYRAILIGAFRDWGHFPVQCVAVGRVILPSRESSRATLVRDIDT